MSPRFCIEVGSERTPSALPSKKNTFNLESDATIASSEDFDFLQHSRASSSQHSVASTVPTLLKFGSSSTRKLAADADHEPVVSVEESVSRGKRDRDSNVVQKLKDREDLHKFLERNAEFAVRGEKSAQKRLSEAEAAMEIRNWEKRNSDIALYETHQEFESHRLQLHQANQWADQAPREKINLCGDLEMRNRLFRKNRAKDCQEIEELRRLCCEETDRARQARMMNCLCIKIGII